MRIAISVALLAVGALLIYWGVEAADSLSSEFSEFFTGKPTDEAMWLLIGGVAAVIVGLLGLLFSRRR